MGFFDKVRASFASSGLEVTIETPGSFDWNDPIIPVQLHIVGDAEADRRVSAVEIRLRDVGADGKAGRKQTMREPFDVPAGSTVDRSIDFHLDPAPLMEAQADAAIEKGETPAPAWLQKAAGGLVNLSRSSRSQQLTVTLEVDGAGRASKATARLDPTGGW